MSNPITHMSRQDKALWSKTAYTAAVVAVSTVLAHIPVYGVDSTYMSSLFGASSLLAFSDVLTGGSFSQLAVGGFAVTSIVFASILMMLAGIIYPKFEKIHSDGESGRRRHDRITLVLAMLLTLVQGALILTTAGTSTVYTGLEGPFVAVPMLEWLAGTFVISYMAQKIHDLGIGNGITVVLAANIASRIPSEAVAYSSYLTEQGLVTACALICASVVLSVVVCGSYLNVPLVQTGKAASVMNASGRLPMPVCISNVLPIVYASCFMMIPSLVSTVTGTTDGVLGEVLKFSPIATYYALTTWQNAVGALIYVVIIALFSLYASRLSFSSPEIAQRMREKGDVIDGVRPGADTERYLERRRVKLAWVNTAMLIFIALVPDYAMAALGMTNLSFLGVSLVILMSAFWDLRLRFTGLTKHWSAKYSLFDESRRGKKKSKLDAGIVESAKEVA